MKMALRGDTLLIKEASSDQFAVIKSWGAMKWDRKTQTLYGVASLELLDKLTGITGLTPAVAARRETLHRIQTAVDAERMDPDPQPLTRYPVKLPLYRHQVRGANMALLTFGWAEPKEKEGERNEH